MHSRSIARRTLLGMAAILALAVVGLGLASPATAQPAGTSQVSVVHGIPGQPVDVYVNGNKALSDFKPGTVAGPLDLPAGTYDVVLTQPGGSVNNPIVEAKGVQVPSGKNLSVVAHLTTNGQPAITPFANDTSQIPAGQARVVVRHVAAAPAVDVRANGQTVFTGLTNPNEDQATVPAGTVSADVVLAGTNNVVLGPTDLNLAAGTSTIVYAIGSAQDNTLGVVTQTIQGLGAAPGGVPAGSGGLAGSGPSGWTYLLIAGGSLLLLGAAGLARRARAGARR